jgi:integrase
VRIKCMRLRIVPINWHPRYKYSIGGLRVNGKRKRLFFETEAAAQAELRNLQIKVRRQGQAGLDISDSLRAMAVDCAHQLKPYNKTLLDATSFYISHLAASESACIRELTEDYLRSQERGRLSASHLAKLRSRLGGFCKEFGERPVRTVSAVEIEKWLFGLDGLGARTLINRRATLHAFFAWMLRQKAVDFNPIASVARPKVIQASPAIWAPEDLAKLLISAPAGLLPVLALGSFAGLRTAELMRLDWSEVNLDRGLIEVKAAKAKSAQRRLVKIEPNLAQWLKLYAGQRGPLYPTGERAYHAAATTLTRSLGLRWPENGLRHSFASYHLAHFQNAEVLALQMGHTSARMIFDHYRELVTPQAAQAYWEIRP